MGIKQRGVFETVRMEKGMKIMGMTTRTEYFAAQHGVKMYKTDTTQAFLYGYVRRTCSCGPQTGGRSLLQRDTASSSKRISTGHGRLPEHDISVSLDDPHGYPAINSEKTMFMKWDGVDFILNRLFVDAMSTIPRSVAPQGGINGSTLG